MASEHTIAPAGRTSPCAPGCRHGQCVALAREETDRRVDAILHRVLYGAPGDGTITLSRTRLEALNELAKLARGDR